MDYHYAGPLFDPESFANIVHRATDLARTLVFDSIVLRGTSGCMVGCPVALLLGKPWGFLPKAKASHSLFDTYRGIAQPGRYIIIDDMVDSGRTVRLILEDPTLIARGASCVGLVLYNQDPDRAEELFNNTIPHILGHYEP